MDSSPKRTLPPIVNPSCSAATAVEGFMMSDAVDTAVAVPDAMELKKDRLSATTACLLLLLLFKEKPLLLDTKSATITVSDWENMILIF